MKMMAPSRGICSLRHSFAASIGRSGSMASSRRTLSTLTSFSERLASPRNSVQSYISSSRDPYLNLSIEDHILRTSPPDSAILFLYTNRPCVVIGRNQNPWHEVNLGMLKARGQGKTGAVLKDTEPPGIGNVDLVRRRSGGGAVFHDEGNLNWSITSPRNDFTRDKHAEMVVRALRQLGVDRARVNERHDIVLDQGSHRHATDAQDTHRTPYTVDSADTTPQRPIKVSGSAYKLTRGRALHHATTLLASPNLHIIPQYLHSPAKAFIDAKGVESVSSPVGNIGIEADAFQQRVQEEFAAMYCAGNKQVIVETVGDELLHVPEIRKGSDELRTKDWILSQTPQFTLDVDLDMLGSRMLGESRVNMTVHHGIIQSFEYKAGRYTQEVERKIRAIIVGQKIQDVDDWVEFLTRANPSRSDEDGIVRKIAVALRNLLPIPEAPGA